MLACTCCYATSFHLKSLVRWAYAHNCEGHVGVQASMQPKAAVEFDQAINYVNKIKVH